MAKIAYKKSLIDTNITILALQKKKLMDSLNVQIYKIDIGKESILFPSISHRPGKYEYFPLFCQPWSLQ
jgi:hypothetical protein